MVTERDNVKPDGNMLAGKADFAVEYLQMQFPWLSKEVIADAIERFGDNHSKRDIGKTDQKKNRQVC